MPQTKKRRKAKRLYFIHREGRDEKREELLHLNTRIDRCSKCSIADTCIRKTAVNGSPKAKILFLTPSPGDKEELSGKAFTQDEHLSDNLLSQVGIGELLSYGEDKRLTQIKGLEFINACLVSCRAYSGKGEHRLPTDKEITNCLPHTLELIEILNLHSIVLVGFYPIFNEKDYPSLENLFSLLAEKSIHRYEIPSFQFMESRGGQRSHQFGEARTTLHRMLQVIYSERSVF